VTTTVYYTTTVTDGPKTVSCTKTVTVTYTSTSTCPPVTVISGHTQYPTAPPYNSATTTPYPTYTPPVTTTAQSTCGAPTTPPVVGNTWDFYGCLGSTDTFPTWSLLESSALNNALFCTTECQATGAKFAGLYLGDCYCADSIGNDSSEKANGFCDLPCPSDCTQTCGGNQIFGKRSAPDTILLDVYEFIPPSSTTSSATCTSSHGSDPSSDPDCDVHKRGIDSDLEVAAPVARDVKVRHGGLLRNVKSVKGPVVARRDFALKAPFGH